MPAMWNRFSNNSPRSSSTASAAFANPQASPALDAARMSVGTTQSQMSAASVRSSKGSSKGSLESQKSSELKDMQELLAFHKSLVQNLGEDLQKRGSELERVKKLTAEQEKQIDTQQADIAGLLRRKADLERKVAELEKQVHEGKSLNHDLLKGIDLLRKIDTQTENKPTAMFPLDSIVKDALIEQLESDVGRLTQQGLDHDRDLQALTHTHKRMVDAFNEQISDLHKHLEHERYIVAKHTWNLAEMTKLKVTAEVELQQQLVRATLGSQDMSNNADTQLEHLKAAIVYALELGNSQRLFQDGKEVELFHLYRICGLAQTQEITIARLSAANELLLTANSQLKQDRRMAESKVSSLVKASLETSASQRPVSPRRNITWDLPFRHETPAEATTPSTTSKTPKLRKRNSIIYSLRDLAPRTAPLPASAPPDTPTSPSTASKRSLGLKLRHSLSFSKPRDEPSEIEQLRLQLKAAREATMHHEQEKQALQIQVGALKFQLSENVEASQALLEVAEEVASQRSSTSSSSGGHHGPGNFPVLLAADKLSWTLRDEKGHDMTVEGDMKHRASAEQETEAYSYLFEDIPSSLGSRVPGNFEK